MWRDFKLIRALTSGCIVVNANANNQMQAYIFERLKVPLKPVNSKEIPVLSAGNK